jgi:elongation factor Tu
VEAGDNIGALLRGVDREGVERGQILCACSRRRTRSSGSEAYILTRRVAVKTLLSRTIHSFTRTTDVTGTVNPPEGNWKWSAMPGDNLKFEVELIAPIAMEDGLRFAIREGGRTATKSRRQVDEHT